MMLDRRARLLEQNVAALRAQLAACREKKCPSAVPTSAVPSAAVPQPSTSNGEEDRVRSALDAAERALVLLRQQMADAEKSYQSSVKEERERREREMADARNQYERDLAIARNQKASELTDVRNQLRIESEKRSQLEVQYQQALDQLQQAQEESITALLKANETAQQALLNDQAAKERALVAATNEQRAAQELALAVKRQIQGAASESKEVALRLRQAKEEAERKLRACQEKKGEADSEVARCARESASCIKERDEVIRQMNAGKQQIIELRGELRELDGRASSEQRANESNKQRITQLEAMLVAHIETELQLKDANESNKQRITQLEAILKELNARYAAISADLLAKTGLEAEISQLKRDWEESLAEQKQDSDAATKDLLERAEQEHLDRLASERTSLLQECESRLADQRVLADRDCQERVEVAKEEFQAQLANAEAVNQKQIEDADQLRRQLDSAKRECDAKIITCNSFCQKQITTSLKQFAQVTREKEKISADLAACVSRLKSLQSVSATPSDEQKQLAETKATLAVLSQKAIEREAKCAKLEQTNAANNKAIDEGKVEIAEQAKRIAGLREIIGIQKEPPWKRRFVCEHRPKPKIFVWQRRRKRWKRRSREASNPPKKKSTRREPLPMRYWASKRKSGRTRSKG